MSDRYNRQAMQAGMSDKVSQTGVSYRHARHGSKTKAYQTGITDRCTIQASQAGMPYRQTRIGYQTWIEDKAHQTG